MNIVIANGPGRLDNGSDVILFPSRWDSAVGNAPFRFYPYELAYLSALLKRELPDANVTMLDGNIRQWDGNRYAAEIHRRKPDVLICELSALTYSTMTRVMQMVHPSRAILCGPMGGYDAGRAYQDGWTDVVVGEYELQVLRKLTGEDLPGEAFTGPGYINLDWLPWPEDEDISRIDYDEINHYARGTVQLYPSRGCPLACTFCVVPTYYGGHGKSHRSHRCRDIEDVCDEIEYLASRYHGRFSGCYFNEEAHNANVEWLVEFCEALIRRGLNRYAYDAMCGSWTFSKELVALVARAGYKQIRFGVESTSEQVGKAIKKSLHREKIEALLGWLKEYGVGAYTTIQVGAPGSTEQTDLATLDDLRGWIRAGLVQRWQVSTSTPQPGTPLWTQAKREGWLLTEDASRLDGYRACMSYPDYPAHRIQAVRDGCGL